MVILKVCSYVGVSLYRPHMTNSFGWGAGFDVDESHVLPQHLLAAITMVGDGAGDGVARDGAGC